MVVRRRCPLEFSARTRATAARCRAAGRHAARAAALIATLALGGGCGDDGAAVGTGQASDAGTATDASASAATSASGSTTATTSDATGTGTSASGSGTGSTSASGSTTATDTGTPTTAATTAPAGCDGALGELPVAAEGEFVAVGTRIAAERPRCGAGLHATAGAEGSTLQVRAAAWAGGGRMRLRVEDLRGEPLVDWTALEPAESVDVALDRSGEVLVRVEPEALDEPANAYELEVACLRGCEREYTRYPLLFVHGMAGEDAYLGVLDYWFRVEEPLREAGYLPVIRDVDAFQVTPVRAEQWKAHIDELVAAGVGRRFHLIAHSQGGMDARYLASKLDPDRRVATITTVATPHRGTAVADLAAGIFDAFPVSSVVIDAAIGLFGGLLGLEGGELTAQVASFSRPAMAEFNADVLDRADVTYWSWAARSCSALDVVCRFEQGGEDIDPLLSITFEFLELAEGPNDGLVSVESAEWGELLGTLPADHLDEVGQIADLLPGAFDHRAFYLSEARRIAAAGG